jgi:hypothetical protein
VYRRRRVLAVAGSLVAAVLFVWVVGTLLGGDGPPQARNASDVRPAGVPLLADPPASRTSNPPTSGALPGSGAPSSSATSSVPPSGRAATTPAATTTTTVPPGPPQPCPDAVVRVTATLTRPSVPSGTRLGLTLHIANTGPVACVRDVSRQLRAVEIRPAAGGAPLWSSADCYTLHTSETRTLAPGAGVAYSVVWAGRTSAPGCPISRAALAPGTYQVVGRLGPLVGPPTTLTVT